MARIRGGTLTVMDVHIHRPQIRTARRSTHLEIDDGTVLFEFLFSLGAVEAAFAFFLLTHVIHDNPRSFFSLLDLSYVSGIQETCLIVHTLRRGEGGAHRSCALTPFPPGVRSPESFW